MFGREAALTPVEAITYVLVALFGVGGPVTVMLTQRAKKQQTVSTEQAEKDVVSSIAEEVGVIDKWNDYSVIVQSIEQKLTERIDQLEESLRRTRKSLDVSLGYAEQLRVHVNKGLPPPPPPWPEDIT